MTIAWPTVDPDLPPPSPPPRRRKLWIWPALAGVVVFVAATVIFWPRQEPRVTAPVAATAPTTTSAPTTTTTPAPPTSESFDGNGDSVLELKRGDRPGVVTFECPKCTGMVVVESNGRPLLKGYAGKRLINVGNVTTTISVKAKGAWKLSVADPENVSGPVSGRGDAVLMLSFKSAKVTHQGKGTFVLTQADLPAERVNTVVSKTGNYQGTVTFPRPALVQIQSTGSWTITPK